MGFSLRFKIILITVAILIFAIGATTLASGYVFSQEYSNVLQSRAMIIGQGIQSQLSQLLKLGIPLKDLIGFDKQMRNAVETYEDIAYAMVVDLDGTILFHNDPNYQNTVLTDPAILTAIQSGQEVIQVYSDQTGQFYDVFVPVVDPNGVHVGAIRLGFPVELVTQKTDRLTTFSVLVALVSLVVAVALLVFLLSVWVTRPLRKLLTAIEDIRSGDAGLTTRVEIDSRDEIGHLGSAFNIMTAQLNNLIDTLEERVTDRTHRLEIVATLGERLNAILDSRELLQEVVDQIKQQFGYYHTQIYLLDPLTKTLMVAASTGSTGHEMTANAHSITLDTTNSPIVQATRSVKIVTVDNVQGTEDWLPNVHLPGTRAEMAVPIIQEHEVVGVLDVHADQVAGLDENDANLLRSLASQVAVALSNARLFEQTTRSKEEAEIAKEKAEQARIEAERAKYEAEQAKKEIETANKSLEVQMWQTAGQAQLNDRMRGEQDISTLAGNVISQLCKYLNARVGTLYVRENGLLRLAGSYAYSHPTARGEQFHLGEGLVGQVALEKQPVLVDVPDDLMTLSSSLGDIQPRQLLVTPFTYNGELVGVAELASLTGFSQEQLEFLQRVMESVAIAFITAQARHRVNDLLEETQRQAEELQAQEEELRSANEELETQTESLRASELKLKTKQAELEQVNAELEEKADALEKNSAVLHEQRTALDQQNHNLKTAQQELELKAQELARASKYKSEFLANMSHELRTPLNSLLILAGMLAKNDTGNLTPDQVESAQVIHSGGTDLLNLINDILDLSKVEAGKMEFHFAPMSLDRLLASMRSQFSHLAESKGLTFDTSLAPDLPETLETDQQRVEQIIKNLLSNAFKFTSRGTVRLAIARPDASQLRTGADPDQFVALSVSDTGIGMTPEQQQIVFEAFQQADGSTSRQYGGTGLGLTISRELAARLGGQIGLVSHKGQGSTFTLFLPLQRPGPPAQHPDEQPAQAQPSPAALQPAPVQPNGDRPAQPKPSPAAQPAAPVQPKGDRSTQARLSPATASPADDRTTWQTGDRLLLVVEDDPKFARVAYDYAHHKQFKCLLAPDGETGLQLAQSFPVDAIILDLSLPGITGWEVLDALKQTPATRHIPVHIISAADQDLDAYKRGAIGFLTKPVSPATLDQSFQRIESFINRQIKSLLLVEDDPTLRLSVRKLLEGNDVRIAEAGLGQAALDQLASQHFDCMILDLSLPDMSGFDLLNRLDTDDTLAKCPVIVYTGRALSEEENRELLKYADSVIVKGVKSPERLLDETALFLHRVIANLPEDKQRTIQQLHDHEAILTGKHILIVDDDARNAFALSRLLSTRGLVVYIAPSGPKALELLDRTAIDLVLMDIMMPGMDGYETTRQVRAHERFRHLPILALTAKAMQGDRDKCLAAGANDYLSKPVDPARLFSMLRVWLSRE